MPVKYMPRLFALLLSCKSQANMSKHKSPRSAHADNNNVMHDKEQAPSSCTSSCALQLSFWLCHYLESLIQGVECRLQISQRGQHIHCLLVRLPAALKLLPPTPQPCVRVQGSLTSRNTTICWAFLVTQKRLKNQSPFSKPGRTQHSSCSEFHFPSQASTQHGSRSDIHFLS